MTRPLTMLPMSKFWPSAWRKRSNSLEPSSAVTTAVSSSSLTSNSRSRLRSTMFARFGPTPRGTSEGRRASRRRGGDRVASPFPNRPGSRQDRAAGRPLGKIVGEWGTKTHPDHAKGVGLRKAIIGQASAKATGMSPDFPARGGRHDHGASPRTIWRALIKILGWPTNNFCYGRQTTPDSHRTTRGASMRLPVCVAVLVLTCHGVDDRRPRPKTPSSS